MKDKMTRWGIGPIFALLSIIYFVITSLLSDYFEPFFIMSFIPNRLLTITGILLIIIGIPFEIVAVYTVHHAFNADRLVKDGIFGFCRHPVYSGWILFIVPGIVLFVNSWLSLTTPFIMYIFLRILATKEEKYLEKMFGEEYIEYKKRIPAVLPIGWMKFKV